MWAVQVHVTYHFVWFVFCLSMFQFSFWSCSLLYFLLCGQCHTYVWWFQSLTCSVQWRAVRTLGDTEQSNADLRIMPHLHITSTNLLASVQLDAFKQCELHKCMPSDSLFDIVSLEFVALCSAPFITLWSTSSIRLMLSCSALLCSVKSRQNIRWHWTEQCRSQNQVTFASYFHQHVGWWPVAIHSSDVKWTSAYHLSICLVCVLFDNVSVKWSCALLFCFFVVNQKSNTKMLKLAIYFGQQKSYDTCSKRI